MSATTQPLPLAELVETYLSNPQKRLDIQSDSTRRHYRRSIRQFGEFLGRPATADDLTDDNLAGWAAAIMEEGMSPATANQRAKQLRALWEWAARQRIVEKFPTFRGVREPERLPQAWAPAELAALFTACREAKGWIGPHRASDWWTALHHWLLDTGERIDATLRLEPQHLDLTGGTARVPAAIRKGGRKPMAYRLTGRTCKALRRLVDRYDGGPVFTQPWASRPSFYCAYRRLVESAGLPHVRHKSGPHKMRITVLTLVQCHGGDATDFARHSARSVTDESYIDRTLLFAHDKGKWPRDDWDPLTPKANGDGKPWWLRVFN